MLTKTAIRATAMSLLWLLVTPVLALAAEEEEHTDQVTEAMFILIIVSVALLAIVAAFEARRQK